jgi:hypothetical protein
MGSVTLTMNSVTQRCRYYYNQLDPSGGGAIFSAVLVLGYMYAYRLVQREVGRSAAEKAADVRPWHQVPWKLAMAVHVLGWYMQIHPGHAMYG